MRGSLVEWCVGGPFVFKNRNIKKKNLKTGGGVRGAGGHHKNVKKVGQGICFVGSGLLRGGSGAAKREGFGEGAGERSNERGKRKGE